MSSLLRRLEARRGLVIEVGLCGIGLEGLNGEVGEVGLGHRCNVGARVGRVGTDKLVVVCRAAPLKNQGKRLISRALCGRMCWSG